MSKTGLKKALKGMSKEEIIEVVCELYDARREAKDYLDYWIDPNPDALLEKFKADIDRSFFYSTGKNRKQPAASDLKKMEKYFSSLVFDPEKTADLLLHIAERHFEWVTRKTSGFQQVEKSVRRSFDNARIFVDEAALEPLFGLRVDRLKEKIDSFYEDLPEQRRGWWRRRW